MTGPVELCARGAARRVRLPDRRAALVKPPWAGRLSGFSPLFEALILTLCGEMPCAAVARLTDVSWHRVVAVCTRHVDVAVASGDLSGLRSVAIDETSRAKGHNNVTVVADAKARRVVFVDAGRGTDTAAFLMPRAGVVEMLTQLDKGRPSRSEQSIFDVASDSAFDAAIRPVPRSQNIAFNDVALIAHHLGVSYQAAVHRFRRRRPACAGRGGPSLTEPVDNK